MQRFEYDLLDSTNDEARRLLGLGEIADVAILTARGQSAGRGTRGRSWVSPRDAGLYLSYVCRSRPDVSVDGALPLTTAYTLAAGVACVEAVCAALGVRLRIKPVNDLIWNGGKVGGILTEAFIEDNRLTALIIGVGLNVHAAERRVLESTLPVASLAQALAPRPLASSVMPDLVQRIAERLREYTSCIAAGGSAAVLSEWRTHLIEGADALEVIKALS